MSVWRAISGTFATIFGLLGSKKWMTRDGLTGISVTGAGAPSASGLPKSRGLRIASPQLHWTRVAAAPAAAALGQWARSRFPVS
jgi:hypothetical protein